MAYLNLTLQIGPYMLLPQALSDMPMNTFNSCRTSDPLWFSLTSIVCTCPSRECTYVCELYKRPLHQHPSDLWCCVTGFCKLSWTTLYCPAPLVVFQEDLPGGLAIKSDLDWFIFLTSLAWQKWHIFNGKNCCTTNFSVSRTSRILCCKIHTLSCSVD